MNQALKKEWKNYKIKMKKHLMTYMTAGLPDMEGTKALIKAQAEAGIDIIELGIPFSDPTADGPDYPGCILSFHL